MNYINSERLQKDANQILDAYSDELSVENRVGRSWGDLKYRNVAAPAGSTINRVAVFKQLLDRKSLMLEYYEARR